MKKNVYNSRKNNLNQISHRYVEDNELVDTPARLFRKILRRLQMTPIKWGSYLRDYLEWVVDNPDKEKARTERVTRTGNIKDTYFQKNSLSFNKLLEGLSIVRMKNVEIIIRCTDESGEIIEVSENITLLTKKRLESEFVLEEE